MNRDLYQAILLNPADNVVCLLQDMRKGEKPSVAGVIPPTILQDTSLGHKVATSRILQGAAVVKYGAVIGHAIKDIEAGEHVHLHNLTGRLQAEGDMT